MKRLFLILLSLFVLGYQTLYTQTGWLRQNLPGNYYLSSVSFVNANTGYLSCWKIILKTTDGGSSWFIIDSTTFHGACDRIQFINANTGFAIDSTTTPEILRTTNSGYNWAAITPPTYCYGFNFIDSLNGYLSFANSYYRTSNGGISWSYAYVQCTAGVGSIDFGRLNVSNFNFGIALAVFNDPIHYRNDVYIYKTTDAISWRCIPGHIFPSDTCIYTWYSMGFDLAPFRKVYLVDAITGFLYNGHDPSTIYVTQNSGNDWTQTGLGTSVRDFCFVNHNTGYAGGNGVILYSTNSGVSWIQQYAGVTSQITCIDFINGFTGWAIAEDGVLLKTTTGGNITVPPPPVMLDPPDGATGISLTPLLQWMQIFGSPVSYSYKVIIAVDTLFTMLRDSATVNSNSYQVPSGKLQNSTLYYWKVRAVSSVYGAGPWSHFFRFTTGINSVSQIGGEVPQSYGLYQNYPNPFNPSTKIKFDLPAPRLREAGVNVQLVIYDALGREVITLVNKQLHPGTYEVEWNGTNFPSGVYFYQLTSGVYSMTNKMVLIK